MPAFFSKNISLRNKYVINNVITFINNNMKKLSLMIASIFLIGACSQSEQGSQTNESQPMVEYVWMTAGPEFNEINLANVINEWNTMIDKMECSLNANILSPEAANEDFDFIWTHIWESESARDECWNIWGDYYKADWDMTIDGIMSYDLNNVYMFKPTVGKQPKMQNDTGSFVNSFYFCTFNDGYSMSDLETYKKALNNTEGFSDYWWYATLEPTFEPADPKPDFVWVDIWASNDDEASDRENWSKTNLPEVVQKKFSCLPDADGAGFIGTVIRS